MCGNQMKLLNLMNAIIVAIFHMNKNIPIQCTCISVELQSIRLYKQLMPVSNAIILGKSIGNEIYIVCS